MENLTLPTQTLKSGHFILIFIEASTTPLISAACKSGPEV